VIDRALHGGCAVGDDARRWQSRAFAFRDDQNCARVSRAILRRLASA
jgi:hypothetical protein